jgi:hypothetical protein
MTKTIRFEVFKRDGFRCQYCGKTPPEVTLEVDHIQPRSKNGTDDINNLLTSCFDCNRGKRDVVLERVPNSIAINLEVLKEKELQLKEYNRFIQKIQRRVQLECKDVDKIFNSYHAKWCLSEKFQNSSLRTFLNRLPKEDVIEAMHNACQYMERKHGPDSRLEAISYFCGICWTKIKRNQCQG